MSLPASTGSPKRSISRVVTLPELPDSWLRNYEHSVCSTCVFSFCLSLTSDISIFWFSVSLRSGSNGPKCSGLVLFVFPGFRAPNLQIHLIRLQIFLPGKLSNLLLLQFSLIPRFLFLPCFLFATFTFLFFSFMI